MEQTDFLAVTLQFEGFGRLVTETGKLGQNTES